MVFVVQLNATLDAAGKAGVDGELATGASDAPPGIGGEDGVEHHGVKDGDEAGLETEKGPGKRLAFHSFHWSVESGDDL